MTNHYINIIYRTRQADEYMKGHSKHVDAENVLDEFFESYDQGEADNFVVKQHFSPGEVYKQGSSVFCGKQKVGKLSYFVHWTPPAILAVCDVHPNNCYATTPLLDGASEDDLVRWIGDGPKFKSADDHLACLPGRCYKQRQVLKKTT